MSPIFSTIGNTRRPIVLPGLILSISIIAGYLLLQQLTVEHWGEDFKPHDIEQTLPVSSTYSYRQSFPAEFSWVTGILLSAKNGPSLSVIAVSLQQADQQQTTEISLTKALPSGELYVAFAEPLHTSTTAPVRLTVSHVSGPTVQLRFQINNRARPEGELTRFNREQGTTAAHDGNIAFRVQYQATLAEQTGLTLPAYAVLALILLIGWLLYIFWQPSPGVLPSLKLQPREYLIVGILIVVTGAVYFPVGASLLQLPTMHDFVKDTLYLDSAAAALRSGQVPYWQHATCGGQPLLGNPEASVISLGTIIALITGPVAGLKILILLEIGIMTAGTYLLARSLGLRPLGAAVPALIVPLSGFVAGRVFLGHTNFIGGLAYLPLALTAFLFGLRQRRWLIVSGLLLALMLFRGDTHLLAYGLLLLALWSAIFAVMKRTSWPLKAFIIVLTILLAVSLPKVLPALSSAENFNGASLPNFFVPLLSQDLLADVFLFDNEEHYPVSLTYGEDEGWENIGLHIGLLAVSLAIFGLLAGSPRQTIILGLTMLIFLALGEGTIYDQVVRHIPFIGSVLRLPSRMIIIAIIAGGMSAGLFIQRLAYRGSLLGVAVAVLLLGLLFLDLSSYTAEIVRRISYIAPGNASFEPQPYTRAYDHQDPARHTISHVASGDTVPGLCLDFNQAPLFNTDIEAPLIATANGSAVDAQLTPNTITIPEPPHSEKLIMRVAPSRLMSVSGGYLLPRRDQPEVIVVANDSGQPLVVSYAAPSLWPGLILAVGLILAFITAPRLAGKPQAARQ